MHSEWPKLYGVSAILSAIGLRVPFNSYEHRSRQCIIQFQGDALCKECFFYAFEEEIHKTIVDANLFTRGETVAIGASGGKGLDLFVIYFNKLSGPRA